MTDSELHLEVADHRITLESIRPYRSREISARVAALTAELSRRTDREQLGAQGMEDALGING